MPFVEDFASRSFHRVQMFDPSVADLEEHLGTLDGEPVALTDGSSRRTVYVHPGQFAHLRETIDVPSETSLLEAGWLDALGDGQISVIRHTFASHVTRLLDAIRGSLAIVVDDAASPVGVFVPSALVEALPTASVLEERPKGRSVMGLAARGKLVRALEVAEANFSDFHSESVNEVGPRPLACGAEGGHFVGSCPCHDHPVSDCRRS